MRTHKLYVILGMVLLTVACNTTKPVIGLQKGNLAPEITATNAANTAISLSSLRGKLVLLEFWDASNSVARKNHFEIQRLYSKYQQTNFKAGNGFEIYSLSIDSDRSIWTKAIQADGVSWPIIVNDPMGWNSKPVFDFKIASLPKYFLINETGEIINHNIIISDLEQILTALKN